MFFAFAIILLVLTRLTGKVVNGSRSWRGFGRFWYPPANCENYNVLMLARYQDSAEFDSSFKKLLKSCTYFNIPLVLILSPARLCSALSSPCGAVC